MDTDTNLMVKSFNNNPLVCFGERVSHLFEHDRSVIRPRFQTGDLSVLK
jgi:hypothetical protein